MRGRRRRSMWHDSERETLRDRAPLRSRGWMARGKRKRTTIPNSVSLPDVDGNSQEYHGTFVYQGPEKTRSIAVQPMRFPKCPICFSTDELTDEHIPMRALGGVVMTNTCKKCNNVLGSILEEELRRVFHAEVRARAESPEGSAIRGRRTATTALRRGQRGDAVLIVTDAHPEFNSVLESTGATVSYALLNPLLAELALLKYAYLAACLWLRRIPDSPSAESVRSVLVAARDDGADVAADLMSNVVRVWPFVRVENADVVGPLFLVEPTVTQPEWMFVMATRIAVRWPLSDVHPAKEGPTADVL